MEITQTDVQLDVHAPGPFQSAISIADQDGTQLNSFQLSGNTRLSLGDLTTLKDATLYAVTQTDDNSTVTYDISYNATVVKSHQASNGSGLLFHFCPMYPFCP
jgi:hypothetical protein